MLRKLFISVLVSIALMLAFGGLTSTVYAEERCVPCEQKSIGLNQSLFASNVKGFGVGFSQFNHQLAVFTPKFNAMARAYTLDAQNTKPEDRLQLTGGCYYQFMGPMKCVAHTWFGYFCLQGSWYCTLLGTCKWIPIGSCQ